MGAGMSCSSSLIKEFCGEGDFTLLALGWAGAGRRLRLLAGMLGRSEAIVRQQSASERAVSCRFFPVHGICPEIDIGQNPLTGTSAYSGRALRFLTRSANQFSRGSRD